jgi:hypothetical protein
MGPTTIHGLPAHVLLVHVVVVLMPLTALVLAGCAAWPGLQRRLGILVPLLALVTLVSVPLTTHAGEWLETHVKDPGPLLARHTELGDGVLPWAIGLFVVSLVLWAIGRHHADSVKRSGWATSVPLRIVVVLITLAVSVGSVYQIYRVGDSGAKAAWSDEFTR